MTEHFRPLLGPNLPVLLRKPGQSLNPRFVAQPLELGLGTRNPRFVAWPLELGFGARNPRFVAWPLELGLGTLNPCFVAWPLELGLGSCLLRCGIGVWLGTSGVAAPMSCTSQSVFCCILHNFASGGKSVTRLMFGLTKATRPPHKMRQRMRQKCVCCVARSAPPSQLVMSVRSTIVRNVLTPTLVGPMLFVKYNSNDIWSC